MGILRFVKPEVVKIDLSEDGQDWVEIKRRLTVGEEKQMHMGAMRMRGTTSGKDNEEVEVGYEADMRALTLSKVQAYLVGWSLDRDVSAKAIEALDPDSFEAIEEAIDKHTEAMEAEKKSKGGKKKSGGTSPS